MKNYWENAVTIADNVRALLRENAPAALKATRAANAIREIVRWKKAFYPADTAGTFLATDYKTTLKQPF